MLGGLERRSALLRPPHSNNSNSTTSQIFKFRNSSLLKDWIKLEDFTVWETERKKNREMQKQNCITGPGSILLSILLAIVGIGKPEMYLFEKFSCFSFLSKFYTSNCIFLLDAWHVGIFAVFHVAHLHCLTKFILKSIKWI